MTNDPRHQKDDKALDQEIEQVRSTWNSLEKEEPPALLDQAVYNQAQRALEGPSGAGGKRRSLRWLGAFATASVVVMALTVVIQQQQSAPLPSAKEVDGLMLDRDQEQDAKPARAEKPMASKAMEAPRAKPALQESSEFSAVAKQNSADAFAEEEKYDEAPSAEIWIEQLLELKNTQQAEILATELARFRSVYPDYHLPPELDE